MRGNCKLFGSKSQLINFLRFLRFIFHCLKGNFQYAFGLHDKSNSFYAWFKHLWFASFYFNRKSTQALVCKLEGDNMGRYAFTLLNTFYLAGVDVYLIPDKNFYAKARGLYIFRLFDFLHIGYFWNPKQLKPYSEVYGLKMRADYKFSFPCEKEFVVDYNTFQADINKAIVPFGFHPLLHIENNLKSEKQLNQYINHNRTEKTLPVFFGGEIFHEDYQRLNSSFPNLLNRSHLFEAVMKWFEDELNPEGNGTGKLHIYDRSKVDIPRSQWLRYLGKAKFFIAAPGFEMPYCHNLIEAMAMGAIPILQYGAILRPPLTSEVNALFFSDIDELFLQIEKAISMPEEEVELMCNAVLNYYQNYLNPGAFVKRITKVEKSHFSLSLVAGTLSLNEL